MAKKKKIPEGGNVPKNRRQCRVCGKVFKSRRGLIFHRKKQSSSDLCRRFGDLSTKISSISSYKDRLEKAKQTQPKEIKDLLKANNDVIFKLKQGVKYCELAKKLCINLTQVSTYFWTFTYFLRILNWFCFFNFSHMSKKGCLFTRQL